jgi:uncharacterized protein (DUF58 family)
MRRRIWVLAAALAAGTVAAEAAGEFSFSAKVDRTSVEIHNPITLVLALTGDVSSVQVPQIEFPDGFSVEGTSRATNFTLQNGTMQRSIGLTYVLVPQREGTYQLGPFIVRHGEREYRTEPIEITVTKPPVPRELQQPEGERILL